MIYLTDSRGNKSTTLAFVAVSWFLVSAVFIYSWLSAKGDAISLTEYSMAVAAVLGIWLGREFTEKRNTQ